MSGRFFFMGLFAALAAGGGLLAQSVAGLGAISGIVLDSSEATVPGARVTVRHAGLGIRREMVTTQAGLFHAVSLTPARGYEVEVARDGFALYQASGIEVQVGQMVTLNVRLQVAGSATAVEVREATPAVEQDKTGVSQVVNDSQIRNLPINGRRVDVFALLTPGVSPDGTFGLLSFRGMPGGNAFLTDGNDTTNQLYNENAGRTRISSQISADAVQEFQVLSSGYSAEFGRAMGGVINTVTRSGSNALHGTGYWFFRNQDFNARDRYSTINPEETRHQAGGSVGGPLRKDRLFYFFNGEITRRDFPMVNTLTRPPLFNAAGSFVGACNASAEQCARAIRFVSRFNRVIERKADQNLLFGKLDYRATDRHSLSASFNFLDWNSPNGIQTGAVSTAGAGVGNNGISTVKTRFGRAAWTAVLKPAVVNEFRFGWFKDRLHDYPNPGLVPPETGAVSISVQGITGLGQPEYLPRVFPTEDRFQFADTLSWTAGRHLVKYGFDIAHLKDVQDQVFQGNGWFTYGTFTDFALDFSGNAGGEKRWQTYTQGFGPPLTETFVRDFNFFVQDQFRVTSRLTLNLGLRYEYNQFSQPEIFNKDYPQTGRIPQPRTNFAPRLGVAYAPGDGRTVLRAGYGIFYARYPGGMINWLTRDNAARQYTISLQGNNAADRAVGPVFPNRMPATDRTPPPGTVGLTFASDNLAAPYVQQADLSLERELMRDLGLTVSYVWSRALKMTSTRDANMGALAAPVTYTINDARGQAAATYTTATYLRANRVDPRYARIGVLEPAGRLWYDAMVVQLRKRASRWLEGTLAYTWAHTIDTNQGAGANNYIYGNTPRTLFNGDYLGEKESSELDQRHRLVLTSILTPRFTASDSLAARLLINNWQLSQITTIASAQFATPTVFVSGAPFPGAAYNTTLNGLGGSSRVPFLRRSSLPIDETYRVDARLSKLLPFRERYRVYLNFEAFNVFNTISNTSVLTQAYQAVNRVLTPVARLGEGSASAGFPDGTNARRAQVSLRLVF